jgi:hypothetical protein
LKTDCTFTLFIVWHDIHHTYQSRGSQMLGSPDEVVRRHAADSWEGNGGC